MPTHDPHGGHAAPGDAPRELGGYRLVEVLGRGGMGEVWRAEREGPGGIRRRAALKRILPRLQHDPLLRDRFLAEARTNARLEHPNIVQVLDFGDQPEPYLVLEFVEGVTAADVLRELIASHQRLPAVAAAFICSEIASGLDYAHRRRDDGGQALQIIHRDVSPQNILISLDGGVKITDFGVARAADNKFHTQQGISIGKVGYMAPEQVAGQSYDARIDVFAIGVVLWELLTVAPLIPRDDANAAVQMLLTGNFPRPSQADPRIPTSLDDVVMPALARDPAQRYPTAGAFAQAARAFVHGLAPGFDSNELVRILSKLMPAVGFHGHSQRTLAMPLAPPPAAYASAHAEVPVFAPAPPPNVEAARTSIPSTMAMHRVEGGTDAPANARPNRIPDTLAPPAMPPSRGAPTNALPAPFREARVLSPAPRESKLGTVIGTIVFAAIVLGGGGLGVWFATRSHVEPVSAPATPLPSSQIHPTAAPVSHAPDPVVPTGVAPSLVADAGTHPMVANLPRASRSVERRAIRDLQAQLGPLRGMVRACLGIRDGSGVHVQLTVEYNGATNSVDSVDFHAEGLTIGPSERSCVLGTLRGVLHAQGLTGPIGVTQEYEY